MSRTKDALSAIQAGRSTSGHAASRAGGRGQLLEVDGRVFVAHGYSISNIMYVVTASSIVVVDTGESVVAAQRSLRDFRERCGDRPISHVIYTHFHGDHIRGAKVMCSAGTHVVAHRSMPEELARGRLLSPHRTRVDRLQFGLALAPKERGVSHQVRGASGYIPPDITFDTEYRFEDGGVRFELYHAPGESADHLMIWLPDLKVLFPGDNFYCSFPMLSNPMKPDRPVLAWANSLDRMRALRPDYLVPSHGVPVAGTEDIDEMLGNYAGAIRHVHDKTVDLLNRGFSLEQILRRVRLPVPWRKLDYLQPRYGRVEWAVRGIVRQYTGWYDLNPAHLDPAPRRALSRTLLDLSGGARPLIDKAQIMIATGHDRLCLELTDVVLAAKPRHPAALALRARALDKLGRRVGNRVEQNLYRSAALAIRRLTSGEASTQAPVPRVNAVAPHCRPPVFILAAPRSFTSVICAMLGQHPQLYGMPELHLFKSETMADWFELCRKESFPRAHGLLRAVAQVYFGEQTERTVALARQWVLARLDLTTGQLLRALGAKVYPATIVEKSPNISQDDQALMRTYRMFPGARFIHLVRHPKGQGASVLNYIKVRAQFGPIPPSHWLLQAAFPGRRSDGSSPPEPERAWHLLNSNISNFLRTVPDAQKRTVRGEDLLADPDRAFLPILDWLGLRTDAVVLERMKHPEDSPYARLGPRGAEFGNDRLFLQSPTLRQKPARIYGLQGAPEWRPEGPPLAPEVIELARQFGYA